MTTHSLVATTNGMTKATAMAMATQLATVDAFPQRVVLVPLSPP